MKELWALFATFLKIGLFTFGGGPAMVPTIKREVVDVHHWMDKDEMVDCLAISQSLPGMLAVNSCIYVGNKVKGLPGALVSAFAMTFPAFLAIVIILLFLGKVEDNPYVLGAFEGIKAASVALILVTVYNMGRGILKNLFAYAVAAISFVLIAVLGINALWAILFGGGAGFACYVIRRIQGNKKEGGDAK